MKYSTYKNWLYILVFFSLFSGLPINGNWGFGFHFSFIGGPEIFLDQYKNGLMQWPNFINWVVMIITHIIILSFPFVLDELPYFKVWLIVTPIIFIITQYFLMGPFVFAFFPFIVAWLVVVIAKPKPSAI